MLDAKTFTRMSEVGKCPRALSASKLGIKPTEPPPWLATSAEEGKWHELRIIEELKADDIAVVQCQEEITLSLDTITLVGHVDGIIYDHSEIPQLLEVKSMSQFEFDRWMREGFRGFPQYDDQLTCYLKATGMQECLYIVKNRNNGYEDRRTFGNTNLEIKMQNIITRLIQVENAVRAGELVPAEFNPTNLECKRCEYKQLCIPEAPVITPATQLELVSMANLWRKGKALVDEGQAMIDEAKLSFDNYCRATGNLKWTLNDLAINLVHYNEQVSYPKAKLLKAFTIEQLAPVAETKEAFDQLRVNDLTKE